jgi:hypothetical protein
MHNVIIVRGRLIGPRNIELDEAVTGTECKVEIIFRTSATNQEEDVFQFLKRLPPDTQSREELDKKLSSERQAWGDSE